MGGVRLSKKFHFPRIRLLETHWYTERRLDCIIFKTDLGFQFSGALFFKLKNIYNLTNVSPPPQLLFFDAFCPGFSRASLKMALRENGGQTLKRATKLPTKVVFIHSEELVKLCDTLPKVPNRVSDVLSISLDFIGVLGDFSRRDFCPFIFSVHVCTAACDLILIFVGIVDSYTDQSIWTSGKCQVITNLFFIMVTENHCRLFVTARQAMHYFTSIIVKVASRSLWLQWAT